MHLRTINHTLQTYRPDAYDSLPSIVDATHRVYDRTRMQSAFRAVKSVFAEYNKWDEYGITLLFKDGDMRPNERSVEISGTTIPWAGNIHTSLERILAPRMLRLWEGQLLPYNFYLHRSEDILMHDITFEQEAVSRLGGLGLVRLDNLYRRRSGGNPEVEVKQGRTTILCSPEVSEALLNEGGLVPIMWEFRMVREGPSDRYRPTATRFRVQETMKALQVDRCTDI